MHPLPLGHNDRYCDEYGDSDADDEDEDPGRVREDPDEGHEVDQGLVAPNSRQGKVRL